MVLTDEQRTIIRVPAAPERPVAAVDPQVGKDRARCTACRRRDETSRADALSAASPAMYVPFRELQAGSGFPSVSVHVSAIAATVLPNRARIRARISSRP